MTARSPQPLSMRTFAQCPTCTGPARWRPQTWELCIQDADDATDDQTCGALSTTGYPVGTFRLHHDRFLAWAP